jgi:phospholipid-binding lipoprotein MlaA
MKAICLAGFFALAGLSLQPVGGVARAAGLVAPIPRGDQPTVEQPKVEQPKAEQPKVKQPEAKQPEAEEPEEKNPFEKEEEVAPPLADPLIGMNRSFYHINDKLYFWVLRPVAKSYKAVLPQRARLGVANFFSNLGTPMRLVSCLCAGDIEGSSTELVRLGMNTTVGVLGLYDPAKNWLKIEMRDTDFGLCFAQWGMGPGWYFTWPLLGPSCGRDTLALPLNMVLNPATFLPGAGLIQKVNYTSLHLGDYEDLQRNALDPYVALRDAYNQHRRYELKKLERTP